MVMFKSLYVIVPSFLLGVALFTFSFNGQAKRPVKNQDGTTADSQCLSGKEFNWLAKAYLEELQQIDSGLTLTDVKSVLESSGSCATLDEYALAIQQYSDELTGNDPVITNAAPVITGAAATSVVQGEFYLFTPTASDMEGDALTFSVQNLPAWTKFDANTGSILGVPMLADLGLYQNIVISVSDGQSTSSLSAITIDVTELLVSGEPSPVLTGIAGYTVYVGTAPDNLPDAIQLDIVNSMDVQSNNTLSINNTYYLYIVPRDVNGNSMVLSNTDVGGYRIYIGNTSNELAPITNFAGGVDKMYWVNQLVAGTYFVSISTYDNNGNETPLSNVARFDLI